MSVLPMWPTSNSFESGEGRSLMADNSKRCSVRIILVCEYSSFITWKLCFMLFKGAQITIYSIYTVIYILVHFLFFFFLCSTFQCKFIVQNGLTTQHHNTSLWVLCTSTSWGSWKKISFIFVFIETFSVSFLLQFSLSLHDNLCDSVLGNISLLFSENVS